MASTRDSNESSKQAMDKGKIESMTTKFSEKFAINVLKKNRKF